MSEDTFRKRTAFVNTLAYFELYWVRGMSGDQIAEAVEKNTGMEITTALQLRGIPRRTATDARRYADGDVDLESLRWRYLSPFQRSLAHQLREDRIRNGGDIDESSE